MGIADRSPLTFPPSTAVGGLLNKAAPRVQDYPPEAQLLRFSRSSSCANAAALGPIERKYRRSDVLPNIAAEQKNRCRR